MSILIPGSRPQKRDSEVRELLESALLLEKGIKSLLDLRAHCPVMVLGSRGYYRDTMGAIGRNDFDIFDDAAFLIAGQKILRFNWNTDPSKVGWNAAVGKPYAMLCPGVWPFVTGLHKGRGPAWRQPDKREAAAFQMDRYFSDGRRKGHFRVYRDRDGIIDASSPVDDDYHAINIHWGGEYGTSSWGCQTAPPAQWLEFQRASYQLAKAQPFLPYVLINAAA